MATRKTYEATVDAQTVKSITHVLLDNVSDEVSKIRIALVLFETTTAAGDFVSDEREHVSNVRVHQCSNATGSRPQLTQRCARSTLETFVWLTGVYDHAQLAVSLCLKH